MNRRSRRQQGFTLVETVIGLAILTAISLALGGTFLVAGRSLSNEANTIAADTAVSHASFSLTRDLESASPIPSGSVSAAPATLNLTYGSPPVAVVYSINGNGDLVRTAGVSTQVAARGIRSVVVVAAGCYLTATIQPSAAGAAPVTLNVGNRPGGCF
jgi:prepilin-type N-terminal cleavage/methylation domain-containing protein